MAEASYHAPYDHCTAAYLDAGRRQNTFVRLAEVGVRGNGHMMMLEKNNAAIAGVMAGLGSIASACACGRRGGEALSSSGSAAWSFRLPG